MTEPMTDAEINAIEESLVEDDDLVVICRHEWRCLRARLDAAEAARDAALARAMPEPVLMETVEQVEALPDGAYRICLRNWHEWLVAARIHRWWHLAGRGTPRGPAFLVGFWVARLPDLPIPTPTQEG